MFSSSGEGSVGDAKVTGNARCAKPHTRAAYEIGGEPGQPIIHWVGSSNGCAMDGNGDADQNAFEC
jgi:hypothetical protein